MFKPKPESNIDINDLGGEDEVESKREEEVMGNERIAEADRVIWELEGRKHSIGEIAYSKLDMDDEERAAIEAPVQFRDDRDLDREDTRALAKTKGPGLLQRILHPRKSTEHLIKGEDGNWYDKRAANLRYADVSWQEDISLRNELLSERNGDQLSSVELGKEYKFDAEAGEFRKVFLRSKTEKEIIADAAKVVEDRIKELEGRGKDLVAKKQKLAEFKRDREKLEKLLEDVGGRKLISDDKKSDSFAKVDESIAQTEQEIEEAQNELADGIPTIRELFEGELPEIEKDAEEYNLVLKELIDDEIELSGFVKKADAVMKSLQSQIKLPEVKDELIAELASNKENAVMELQALKEKIKEIKGKVAVLDRHKKQITSLMGRLDVIGKTKEEIKAEKESQKANEGTAKNDDGKKGGGKEEPAGGGGPGELTAEASSSGADHESAQDGDLEKGVLSAGGEAGSATEGSQAATAAQEQVGDQSVKDKAAGSPKEEVVVAGAETPGASNAELVPEELESNYLEIDTQNLTKKDLVSIVDFFNGSVSDEALGQYKEEIKDIFKPDKGSQEKAIIKFANRLFGIKGELKESFRKKTNEILSSVSESNLDMGRKNELLKEIASIETAGNELEKIKEYRDFWDRIKTEISDSNDSATRERQKQELKGRIAAKEKINSNVLKNGLKHEIGMAEWEYRDRFENSGIIKNGELQIIGARNILRTYFKEKGETIENASEHADKTLVDILKI